MEKLKAYEEVNFEDAVNNANVNNNLKKYLLSTDLDSAIACLEDVMEVEWTIDLYLLLEQTNRAWFQKTFNYKPSKKKIV